MPNVIQTFELTLPFGIGDVWAWHERPGAFARLAPPWESMELIQGDEGLHVGAKTIFRVRKAGVAITWVAEHTAHEPPNLFVDEQQQGPFHRWRHEHRFAADPSGGCTLVDHLEWTPPGGPLGAVAVPTLRATNARMFAFRHERLTADLTRHHTYAETPRKTIAITGVTGLVGSALSAFLTTGGHRVVRIVRRDPQPGDCLWNVRDQTIDAQALEGVDAVIHLAGASVSKPWTPEHKAAIADSRVDGTRLLANALAALPSPPEVLVSASAIGIYGNRGDEVCTEESKPGTGFLAEVGQAWESEAQPARDAGIRVVHPRIGIVTTAAGGALAAMLPAFRAGAGGPIGPGTQWVSWIALDDLVGLLYACVMDPNYSGPINAVAPHPIQQAEQAKRLGQALSRPALLPLPAAAVRTLFGEMGEELILGGQRVEPKAATDLGFTWRYPTYAEALGLTLGVD